MISIKFLNLFIFCLYFINSKTASSQIVELQRNISVSRLTGGHRPAEISLNYTINSVCKTPLAKYVVSLRKSETEENFGHTHFCGGVIIKSNLILTAAHCVISNKEPMHHARIRVVAKTPIRLKKTPYTQILRVKKIVVHELFKIGAFNFDIALLRLRGHIKFDKNCASAIDVPKYRINNKNFSFCSVLGWGKLFMHGPLANEILQLNVMLHSKDFCGIIITDLGESKICANDLMDYEKNPCAGDSGGPLICDGHLTGLVSFGFNCGFGLPTVYTEVYAYKSWIEKSRSEKLETMDIFLCFILVFGVMNYLTKIRIFNESSFNL